MLRISRFLPLISISTMIALCACGPRTKTLTVFAATSLTNAQEELARSFEEKHPDITVKHNFASSSTLATQIREGARADIFASANALQMDRVGGKLACCSAKRVISPATE